MSNLTVKIHKNVDFSIRDDIEQEQAIISNEFSSILAPAIRRAWLLAHSLGHGQVLVEHFITALFAEEESRKILERHGYFDGDGEEGQALTKKRSDFGAPTFDQMAISPGKLLPSPHLDAWFRAARDVARNREVEHVTLVVDDFIRALGPDFPFSDQKLAGEIAEGLAFAQERLGRQSGATSRPSKTYLLGKIEEVVRDLRNEANAAYTASTQAMGRLSAGLQQLAASVDALNQRGFATKSDIDASIHASSAALSGEVERLAERLHQLEVRVHELNLTASAIRSDVGEGFQAADAARSNDLQLLAAEFGQLGSKIDEIAPRLSSLESQIGSNISTIVTHNLDRAYGNLTVQFGALQDSLADMRDVTQRQLSAREFRFGRTLNGFLALLAIIAGTGIGLVARMTLGPL